MANMKFVIDDRIPFIRGVFEPHAEVIYLPGGEIKREHLLNADGLLVRTRTRCDKKLLEGTRVKFIGTATIGFDHIDTEWCESNGITWTNAPGCNSGSVAQYITAVLLEIAERRGFDLKDKTLGIIGVGHVGKKVERIARLLGMHVLLNDPPRERAEGTANFTGLHELLQTSDIVTIHVPLNREGVDKTYHLVDKKFLENLKPGAALINSSRGEVIDEAQVVRTVRELKESKKLGFLALDVWENEPDINRELLGLADIATPHIAGYSQDGKHNATRMIAESACRYFGLSGTEGSLSITPLIGDNLILNPGHLSPVNSHQSPVTRHPSPVTCHSFVQATYDIMADDRRLHEFPETFEKQRNNYPVRREFSAYTIEPFPEAEIGQIMAGLEFKKLKT
jgi:erythronate-4-phosphate dehydrogenase